MSSGKGSAVSGATASILSAGSCVLLLCLTSLASLTSCNERPRSEPGEISLKDELVDFLDSLETEYERACLQTGLANWKVYNREAGNLDSAKQLFARIFLDSSTRATIDRWSSRTGSLGDPLLDRRLEMWRRCFAGGAIYADPGIAALENSLQELIAGFRPLYGGARTTRATVDEKLKREPDPSVRRRLWTTRSELSARAAEPLARLVGLRNERARALGYSDYYSMALALQSIDEVWLLETLEFVEASTRDPFMEFLQDAEATGGPMKPWDFDFAVQRSPAIPDRYFPSDSVFPVIHGFESSIGFAVDSLPILETVLDLPYGGLSLGIAIPGDSRFIVKPAGGYAFFRTAFHEYGHSLKAVHVAAAQPILKGYEWIPGAQCAAFEEGVAELHAEFTSDPEWLSRYTKAPALQIGRFVPARQTAELYRVRRLLRDFAVEYAMYKHPDRDPAQIEREMTERYLLVSPGDEPHHYAGNVWYTAYPCYFQNYILGGMMSAQLYEAIADKFGESRFEDPGVSAWMVAHLYRSGETEEWTDRIRHATGKSLETGPFLRKLGIDSERYHQKPGVTL